MTAPNAGLLPLALQQAKPPMPAAPVAPVPAAPMAPAAPVPPRYPTGMTVNGSPFKPQATGY